MSKIFKIISAILFIVGLYTAFSLFLHIISNDFKEPINGTLKDLKCVESKVLGGKLTIVIERENKKNKQYFIMGYGCSLFSNVETNTKPNVLIKFGIHDVPNYLKIAEKEYITEKEDFFVVLIGMIFISFLILMFSYIFWLKSKNAGTSEK